MALIALYLAFNPNETILNLVGYAWAGFGSAFGPMVLLSLYWKRMNKWGALAGMIVGATTVIIWSNIDAVKEIYEMIPGLIASTIAIILVSLLTKKPATEMNAEFEQAIQQVKS